MRSFDAALRTSLDFIAKPHKLWSSGRLSDRHAVLKLVVPGGFQYHRNTGLRTAETPLPFTILGGLSNKQYQVAEREGFEPSVRFEPYARFPGVYLKPLGHLSCGRIPAVTGRGAKNKPERRSRQLFR